jgi:site-specific DNA-methyltransferase (adenine-specific)
VEPYYSDDLATVYLADCREVLPTLGGESIDFIFTDPPYGHNNNNNGDLAHRWEAALGILPPGASAPEGRPIANDGPEANELVQWFYTEARRLLKPGCCCCCCCGGGGGPDPQFARWSLWMDEAIGFKQAVVWDKGGLGMGWHYRRNYELVLVAEKPGAACKWYGGHEVGNVVRLTGIKPSADDHPTPKPVSLPARFIEWHSLPGDIVVDPFVGGGSTAVAAKRAGRRFIGMDVDERWCELTAKRLAQGAFDFGDAA